MRRPEVLLAEKRDGQANSTVSVNLNDAVSHGVECEIRDGVQVKFPHQVGAVRFRCFNAQAESGSNLFGSLALGDELDHFAFPRRQHCLLYTSRCV